MRLCIAIAVLSLSLAPTARAGDPPGLPPDLKAALDGLTTLSSQGVQRWQGIVKVASADQATKRKENTTATVTCAPGAKPACTEVVSDNPVMKEMAEKGKQPPFFCAHLPFWDPRAEIALNVGMWSQFDVQTVPEGKAKKVVATLKKPPADGDPAYQAAGATYVAKVEFVIDDLGRLAEIHRIHQTRGKDSRWAEEWVLTVFTWTDGKPGWLPVETVSGCEGKNARTPGKNVTRRTWEYAQKDGVTVVKRASETTPLGQWTMDVTVQTVQKAK